MVQGKSKSQLAKVKEREIAETRDIVAPSKSVEPVNHWGFLDEIEAPMWVDLNLEASSSFKDNHDDWFETSHPFHQCSSRKLISVFPHVGEGNANTELGIQAPSSPKLPPSVSRSRGKQYRTREWGQSNFGIASNKPHPVKNLSSKSSWVNLESDLNIKTKPSNGYRKGNARAKENSVCASSLTETNGRNYQKPSSSVEDSKTSSSSAEIKEVGSKSASTITYEASEHQHKKSLEVSRQTVSHRSGLLSTLKVTLRKSCVTRQASRVERDGGRRSDGGKSSSGKSSVGSSSHPGYDVKNTTFLASKDTDITPDSRNVTRLPQGPKGKVKVSNGSKESIAKTRDLSSKCRWGNKSSAAGKSAHMETVKSKVKHSNAMRLHRVNEQGSMTVATKVDSKVGVNKYNRLGDGKENSNSQRSNMKVAGMVQVHKVTKKIAPQKSDRTRMTVPKGKTSGRSEAKSLTNVQKEKVYFR